MGWLPGRQLMRVSFTERVERNAWPEGGETNPGNDGKQGFIKKLRMSTGEINRCGRESRGLM